MKRAIREHSRDFAAIIALVVLALVTVGVIFSQQRLSLPAWVPVLGSERFELKAELSSAQAVTPGQGQTVNIAGIKVGDVSQVELEDGAAVVTMDIDEEYVPLIHDNASILLRPKTGLQDMTLELDPGKGSGEVEEGSTIPLARTQPNVNPDQILAALDADTRDSLTLLLQGGAEGLGGERKGQELSAGFRRFEPTARDLAKISSAVAKRRANLRSVVHTFRQVSEELGRSDTRLADFVSSSNSVMGALARQEASIRAALQELPGALEETNAALQSSDGLSLELGPAAEALRPAARALAPALRQTRPLFRETLPSIQNQLRPFARRVQPTVVDLRRASDKLGAATPPLARAFGDLNDLLNALAFNPAGTAEEGYLFWASWLNHNTNATLFTQDGGGPLLHAIAMLSCQQAALAEPTVRTQPFLKTVQELTNVPRETNNPAC
jgi:phospholipid/cholesterol/gamma-HCH transport system substrate-binding protein